MNEPLIITYDCWYNSQLSVIAPFGGVKINGVDYCLISDHTNYGYPDLLHVDWLPVYKKLGREKTIGLIKNGTSLKVAKDIIKTMKPKKNEEMAMDCHDLFTRD